MRIICCSQLADPMLSPLVVVQGSCFGHKCSDEGGVCRVFAHTTLPLPLLMVALGMSGGKLAVQWVYQRGFRIDQKYVKMLSEGCGVFLDPRHVMNPIFAWIAPALRPSSAALHSVPQRNLSNRTSCPLPKELRPIEPTRSYRAESALPPAKQTATNLTLELSGITGVRFATMNG